MAAVTSTSRTLVVADRWFRGWGAAALLALLATGAMLALSLETWRAPFVLAHLCALLALVPLGIALVAHTFTRYREERGSLLGAVQGTLTHDHVTTLLVAVTLVAVAVSLSQFDGGVRAVRSAANLTTVAVIGVLVARYLRRSQSGDSMATASGADNAVSPEQEARITDRLLNL